jgi:Ca2+-binding RTX toxin-like protein
MAERYTTCFGTTIGGKDLFVFADHCSMTVGTHNTIYDFSQAQGDQIEFSHVAGVTCFSDLSFAQSGADTIITAGADQVTLSGVSASTLQASDFRFS